jgi:hypothetical protein
MNTKDSACQCQVKYSNCGYFSAQIFQLEIFSYGVKADLHNFCLKLSHATFYNLSCAV